MSSIQPTQLQLLKIELQQNYIPYLPVLLDNRKPQEEQDTKNLSRAFSAFALSHICDITPELASLSVVDDFDDKAIDAIYYHPIDDSLYIVQSKLKISERFGQDEALSFCHGIQKVLRQDLDDFNSHVRVRRTEIDDAIEQCSHIKIVVAYGGPGISAHAFSAFKELFGNEEDGDERLENQILEFSSVHITQALMKLKAPSRIDAVLKISNYSQVKFPKVTYFGLIALKELVKLHKLYEVSLYEKNIRTFLGQKTNVNIAIRETLAEKPEDFLYFHNGVAVLCEEIIPKNTRANEKNVHVKGLSVINGAQTIASAAQYLDENPNKDISSAKVFITLIKSSSDSEFGKNVTKARNHQNSVTSSNFAALDDNQERLRRELAFLDFNYSYKAGMPDGLTDPNHFNINEAASALALFGSDPRFTVTLKREPALFSTPSTDQYKAIFAEPTGQQLVNAVLFFRYIQERMNSEIKSAGTSLERLTYKHGFYALGWILAKRLKRKQASPSILDVEKIKASLSSPFDDLRQAFFDEAQKSIVQKGPLAFFKSQTDVIPLLTSVLINYFGLADDQVLIRKVHIAGEPYPVALYKYILERAPQIID